MPQGNHWVAVYNTVVLGSWAHFLTAPGFDVEYAYRRLQDDRIIE
jgi:hypothetical protein